MIEIKNLNKYYSKGRSNEVHAVNDVSMSLPDNGMVAIFGKSGCGKTTLLNIIGGLDNAQDGSARRQTGLTRFGCSKEQERGIYIPEL